MEINKISSVLVNKVRLAGYKFIETLVFKYDGIIFGGYVRDEYVREYNIGKYRKSLEDQSKFIENYWNKKVSPETNARTLIPRDMDIAFNTTNTANEFIKKVKELKNDIKSVNVSRVTNGTYYSPNIEEIIQMEIIVAILPIPFISNGTNISLYIDIIVPKYPSLPPFGNIDMLCNGFIKTPEGKRFSNNTGTKIDTLNDYDRHKIVGKILDDLVQRKTYIYFSTVKITLPAIINKIAIKRLNKMQKRKYHWTFINMPFKTEQYIEKQITEQCCICIEKFRTNNTVAYTTIKKDGKEIISEISKMHFICCMKYLEKQITEDEFNLFKCPCRNTIDFRQCKQEAIEYINEIITS